MDRIRRQDAGRSATNTGCPRHRTEVTDSLNESVGANGWRDSRVKGHDIRTRRTRCDLRVLQHR